MPPRKTEATPRLRLMSDSFERRMNSFIVPVMVTILLGLGSWNLQRTSSIQAELAVVNNIVSNGKESRIKAEAENSAEHRQLQIKLEELVSRREFDVQVSSIKAQILSLEARVAELSVALKNLEIKVTALELQIKTIK